MPEKDRFPIRYGRGHSRVTIYNRTTALNRLAHSEARQRAQGVLRGGLGAVVFAIRQRLL